MGRGTRGGAGIWCMLKKPPGRVAKLFQGEDAWVTRGTCRRDIRDVAREASMQREAGLCLVRRHGVTLPRLVPSGGGL